MTQHEGDGEPFPGIAFSHAFQPIVRAGSLKPVSYEALIRGAHGEPPGAVFGQVPEAEMGAFDQYSRERAIVTATKLGLEERLNLNFFPGSLLHDDGIYLDHTISAAEAAGFNPHRLMIEITETEVVNDIERLVNIVNEYRRRGLSFSIDDFGSGYAGLNLLADLQPEELKLDIQLIQNIDKAGPRQAIVSAVCSVCLDLGITVLAEGVETYEEYNYLKGIGVDLVQGYLFAKPGFESLPEVVPLPVSHPDESDGLVHRH